MTDKNVYSQLVKDSRDVSGFIAYGLYKATKRGLATQLELDGYNPTQIRREMRKHHDNVSKNSTDIDQYKERGDILYLEVLENARQGERTLHEEYKTKEPERLKENIDAGIKDWVAKAHEYSKPKPPSFFELAWKELGKMLLKQIALFILAAIVFYLLILAAPSDVKRYLINKILVEPLTKEQPEKPAE